MEVVSFTLRPLYHRELPGSKLDKRLVCRRLCRRASEKRRASCPCQESNCDSEWLRMAFSNYVEMSSMTAQSTTRGNSSFVTVVFLHNADLTCIDRRVEHSCLVFVRATFQIWAWDRLSTYISRFFSAPPEKFRNTTWIGHDRFIPNPFQFINHYRIRRYVVWDTGSVVK